MGFPFRHSRFFSRETRRNERESIAAAAIERKKASAPKPVQVERQLTDAERKEIAEMKLRDRGIEEPRHPHDICAPKLDQEKLMEEGMKGLGFSDLASDRLMKGEFGKIIARASGYITGVVGYLSQEVIKESECRERRAPDYEKDKRKYQAEYDYELSKVPTTGKVLEHVPITDPRHPAYVKPAPSGGPAPNNWETEFTTDGRSVRVRTRYRF